MPTSKPQKAVQPSLSPSSVLDAALVRTQKDGIDFSMRALASDLDVWPMAIYRHYRNREALIEAIVDTVLARALTQDAINALCDVSQPWRSRFETFCLHMYDVYVQYPGVAQKVLYGSLYTPSGLRLVETVAGMFVDLGVDRLRAASIFQAVGFFVCEMAMLDYARRRGDSDLEGLLHRIGDVKDQYPIAHDYIQLMASVELRDRLKTGLGLFSQAVESELP